MIKKYKITGLDCPNCAKVLEGEINKQSAVKKAEINFIKESLIIDSDNQSLAYRQAVNIAAVIEPEVKIIQKETFDSNNNLFTINIITLVVGLILAVLTLTLKMSNWLYWTLFVASAILLGYKTYTKAIVMLLKGKINENLLVTISVVGAVCIGSHMEGLMVIGLYSIGKFLESLALTKSKKSIADLTKLNPETVTILIDGKQEVKSPQDVNIGDLIVVKAGQLVALDGVVESGKATLNMQSITGESLPVNAKIGDDVKSGSIVLDNPLIIRVTNKYVDSTAFKIINLIENAQENKSKTETFISKIAKWYTLAVIILACLVFGVVYAVSSNFNTALYRGLIFLVVSCPCAFAISVPLSYFSGLGNASKNGILIKGSNYLDLLSNIQTVAFDKTGTLTTGQLEITNVEVFDKNYSKDDIIFLASIGEQYSAHPLAKAIVSLCKHKLSEAENVKEVPGEGVYYTFKNKKYFAGKKDMSITSTVVELYKSNKKLANIYFSDKVKESSLSAIKNLKEMKIKTVLLSGDKQETAEKISKQLKIDEVHYNLLPEDKYNYILNCKKQAKVAFVGDGINDAPALALADVGISMGINGSYESINSSDVVLVDDNPNGVSRAVKISKYTKRIVWQNIIFSMVVKILFLTLGAFGVTGMLSAVIADVGVTLVAIFNSLRALNFKCKNKQKNS